MNHYTDEQKKMAVDLRRKGLLLKEICKITGINHPTTITKLCRQNGMLPRNRWNRTTYEVGQKHNDFTIVRSTKHIITEAGKHHTRWECLCDCGKLFVITTKQIKRGQKSCGCHKFNSMFRRTLTDDQANIRKILRHYQASAKKRGFCWELTEEQATQLLFFNCFYCGSQPSRICDYLKYCKPTIVSGIDRKDNKIGYVINNCVSCCKVCNRAKLDASKEEFETWAKNFITNFKGV
jgi:hypothetical protein